MKRLAAILLLLTICCWNYPARAEKFKQSKLIEWEKLNAKVVSLYKEGNHDLALVLAKQSLQMAEDEGGYNHPTVAQSMNNLALLYKTLGWYEEAERLYYLSLTILQLNQGPEHPSTAASLNNLAALYIIQGKYEDAESYYKRALSIKIREFGKNHLSTALSLSNIADLYFLQGKYTQAEPLFQHVIAIRENKLGSSHPLIAESLNKLGNLYNTQGQYIKAEPLYKRSLAILEKAPLQNNSKASIIEKLVSIYRQTGREEAAAELEKRSGTISTTGK